MENDVFYRLVREDMDYALEEMDANLNESQKDDLFKALQDDFYIEDWSYLVQDFIRRYLNK